MCPVGDVRLRLDIDAILANAMNGNTGQVANFSNIVGFGMLSGATTGIESFGTAGVRYYADGESLILGARPDEVLKLCCESEAGADIMGQVVSWLHSATLGGAQQTDIHKVACPMFANAT